MSNIIGSTYELIEELGSGGGGVVYLAQHLRLGKQIILKADRKSTATDLAILRREVDILKELKHPYIPQVHDYFIEDGKAYTAMELIPGESLDKPLERGERFSQPQVIQWAMQLLQALEYLHSPIHGDPPHGYVHSDIKPANIIRTPSNDICLIDFNIALALGEEYVFGYSDGYASPEHYGLDYSSLNSGAAADRRTVRLKDSKATMALPEDSLKKRVIPDVRSDIYSLGATLYHLLSGRLPETDARKVIPLSEEEASAPVAAIIAKAMNPNPDFRYQTAAEMLTAFRDLYKNDPRTKRLRRRNRVTGVCLAVLLVMGIATAFVGLKRMQTVEQWLKLAEYSQNSLAAGDLTAAIEYAMQALPTGNGILQPSALPQAQKALTNALNVYDLSDGYKIYGTVELPAKPIYLSIAPNGTTLACISSWELSIIDTENFEIIAALPVAESALSEVKYIDSNTIVYAGKDGLTVYDIAAQRSLWTGDMATGISVSEDGTTIAAVYRNEDHATIYHTADGAVCGVVDFNGRQQAVVVNDVFANPKNNLFSINEDGTLLGVSFDDGSLEIFDLEDPDKNIVMLEAGSGYTHFEGGFLRQYFAFSASTSNDSMFVVIDTIEKEQTGGFQSDEPFSVAITQAGICVQTENLLVLIDPETGEQTSLITCSADIWRYATNGTHTIISTGDADQVYNEQANLMTTYDSPVRSDFLAIADDVAVLGSMDSATLRIMRYEGHIDAEVFAYDTRYYHNEARISIEDETVILFSYMGFRVFHLSGELIADVELSNAEQVYDQQFVRKEGNAYLQVIYNDGTICSYSGRTGELLSEIPGSTPDSTLQEEFETDEYRIVAPLHGCAEVYDLQTGKLLWTLDEDAYLTYVTQVDIYIVTQYITADGYCYGQLLNSRCEVLAELPYLCDIVNGVLYFDYPDGKICRSEIYELNQLIQLAQNQFGGTT